MSTMYLDLETYCEVPISFGTHVYAENAEIILVAWAIDDGDVIVRDLTQSDATKNWSEVASNMDAATTIVIHNSAFDRTVARRTMGYEIPINKIRDTMITALAHSLPGALGKLCEVMNVPVDQAKDKDGKRLIQMFCVPRPKNQKIRRATFATNPQEWDRFKEYARLDIEAMRAIDKKLPRWNLIEAERQLWFLDQRINDRGVQIDLELVGSALDTVSRVQERLAERTSELTDYEVLSANQRDQMLHHILNTYEVPMIDLRASTIERMLENSDNYPLELIELLNVRLQSSTTSVAKYKALEKATSSDGRLRGTLQFCGASRTGRWAGRIFQPQNLPRPTLSSDAIDVGIDTIKAGAADLVIDNVIEVASSALRGVIIAPFGKKLVVSDLANIEGRVLAWLAGEDWKLDAFRNYDTISVRDHNGHPIRMGHDLYKLTAGKILGKQPQFVSKQERQSYGKITELSMGFEGGVGAFLTFASAYGIDLDVMADLARPALSRECLSAATQAWDRNVKSERSTHGLKRETWIVVDAIKRSWREAHPATVALWQDVADAVRTTISNSSDKTIQVGVIGVRRDKAWLRIILPSNRSLCYPSPRLDGNSITYMGVNQFTRKWERVKTYPGKLIENITQAVARDVIASSMPLVEAAGYEIVLSIHDELITQTPDTAEFNKDGLSSIMSTNPIWAPGLPLAAAGFETTRYRKDD